MADAGASEDKPGWYVVHGGGWRAQARRVPHYFAGVTIAPPDSFGMRLRIAASPSACRRIKAGRILDREASTLPPTACLACREAIGQGLPSRS